MSQDERRGRRRFSMSWPILVMQDDQELARGSTENISRSGAFFRSLSAGTVEEGMTVSVKIGVPEAKGVAAPRTITGNARVVRLEEADGGCGIALHFSEEVDPFSGKDVPHS